MAVRVTERAEGRIVEVTVTGRLHFDDYARLVPRVQRLIKHHGKVRVLLKIVDFKGRALGAPRQDLKLDAEYLRDIERLAVVDENRDQQRKGQIRGPLRTAQVRHFSFGELNQAYGWIDEGFDNPHSCFTSCGTAKGIGLSS